MFNATVQSGTLFSSPQNQNIFGQASNSQPSFFGASNTAPSGTTIKYVPFNGTDTIQKNNSTVNVQTKLNCISAMKEYEAKSLEELRLEDYTANRIVPQKTVTTGMFGNNQSGTGLFNTQASMFQSNSPFNSNQQSLLGNSNNSLFGNNQTNTFGQKTLFGGATTPTSSAFGTFNIQPKQNTLFGMNTSAANKPFFGTSQPTQSTSVFGTSQQSTAPLFGSQQPSQSTSLFGGLSSQQTGLFNSNTTSSSFGFQSQPQTGLFGNNNVSKPFPFTNTTPQSSAPVFGGNTASTGGLFSQNNQSFGSTSKSLFSNPSTFSTSTNSQAPAMFSQQPSGFGQQTNPFQSNQPKPNTPFGTTNSFNSSPKPGLFGTNTNTSTSFGNQNTGSIFGNIGSSNQPFGLTTTTNAIAPINNTYQIGMTNPADAAYQQQIQQKILNLATNRPYGVNKLFMGQNLLSNETKTLTCENNVNNMNLSSLVIKRNENDNSGTNHRRRILNQKTKVIPHQLYKVFSGFDEDEELSTKSNNIDNFFFTKREDWKYLPPNAFEKSRKSLNVSLTNSNDIHSKNNGCFSSFTPISHSSKEGNTNYCSTPISNDLSRKPNQSLVTSPIHPNGRSSPLNQFEIIKRDSLVHNNTNEISHAESDDVKKEVIDKITIESKSEQNEANESESDLDDESVNLEVQRNCHIKLTKPGYYTNPNRDILDQFVSINEYGKPECWIENLIIGRKKYGYIKFLGVTDVYGLDLDELVIIQQKEVIVYPDDEGKPIEGNGLNKPAEVMLMEVWPVDKSTGAVISDASRLLEMKFEERLRRSTERMDAKFISYKPENGVWIFRVEHFSKYTFQDDSDEEQTNETDQKSSKISSLKKETKLNLATSAKNKNQSNQVVTAEADSLSNLLDFNYTMNAPIQHSSVFNKLLDAPGAKNVMKMKQSCILSDSDEDMQVDSPTQFQNLSARKNIITMVTGDVANATEKTKDCEPKSKKFQTIEMGEQILNSSQNNSLMNMYSFNARNDNAQLYIEERGPIKPLESTYIAPTSSVPHCRSLNQQMVIPCHLRDLRSSKLPYLFLKFINYFDSITPDLYKRCSSNVSVTQGNRFRVGLHTSCDTEFPGMKYFRINRVDHPLRSFNDGLNIQTPTNALVLMNLSDKISSYQKHLMETALSTSKLSIDPDTKCPKWSPSDGLHVLDEYMKSLSCLASPEPTNEQIVLTRIIRLCNALWNTLDKSQESLASSLHDFMHDLRRKQLLSNWIKYECRSKLTKLVESLLNTASIDIDQCNNIILNAICSGEIELACSLSIVTKQHRLSLLIAQAASDMQGRELIREQLNSWIQSRTDIHIPTNVLQIYLVLSGQTNITLSNGSIIAPLKHMNWVQALGISFWFSQSYLGSIRSAIELYDDSFKTELDIPYPYPIDVGGLLTSSSFDLESANDDYRYYDCCYHLIKLYCDPLHDLEKLLNPPTVSRSRAHAVCMDWSVSWHLSNVLASIGLCGEAYSNTIPGKISTEFAAQLERNGSWTLAAFVLLHVIDATRRQALMTALLDRNVTASETLTENELFVVDRLKVPREWVHEAKARHCKSLGPDHHALEAMHRCLAGQHEISHTIYTEHVLPRLLVDGRHDAISRILIQFTKSGIDRTLPDWPYGGAVFHRYIGISKSLDTLQATSALATFSVLVGPDDRDRNRLELDLDLDLDLVAEETENHINILRNNALALLHIVRDTDSYRVNTDIQRICKLQIVALCDRVLQACSTT